MDEQIAAPLIAALASDYRFLTGARVLALHRLGRRLGILVDRLDDSGRVQYSFALVVVDLVDAEPKFIVTAEVNELSTGPTDSHFLGMFRDSGHHNLGLAAFGDVAVFTARALAVARDAT